MLFEGIFDFALKKSDFFFEKIIALSIKFS